MFDTGLIYGTAGKIGFDFSVLRRWKNTLQII